MAKKNEETNVEETKVKATPDVTNNIPGLADECERGKHGTGRERFLSLGDHYEDVQAELRKRAVKAKK